MFLRTFAMDVANGFVDDIASVCEKIEIVGSIRRKKDIVNDIDILVIPKTAEVTDALFPGAKSPISLLDAQLAQMRSAGRLVMERNGPRVKRFCLSCDQDIISIDLYIATPETWWTLLLIRTGSRANNILLAARAAELNMQLKADGSGILDQTGKLLPMESEMAIYGTLRLPYRPPEERE
jgi:DNA polymerase/3'-5' exonuclease PolX